MRIAASKQVQQWPTMSASGRYLGTFRTTTPTRTYTGRPRLGYLGQASSTPVMSVEQVISQVNPSHSSPDDALMTTAISGGQLSPAYNTTSECAKAGKGPGTGATVAGSIGTSTMGVGTKLLAANPLIGGIVMAGGAIVSLIAAILAHHGQAVANEQAILCTSVPATNAALAQVVQDVQSGAYSPAQGIQYLQQILSSFQQAVAPITKSCNESCGLTKELQGIVAYLTSQFQAMPVSGSGVAASAASVASSLGIPTWALVAAAAVGAFLLLGD